MFLMSQDQILGLAILMVVLLSVGGMIAGVIYWWRDMKRGLTHAPILANGWQRTGASEQPSPIGHGQSFRPGKAVRMAENPK